MTQTQVQELASTLEALVRHRFLRRWEINIFNSEIHHVSEVFRGLVVWGMPDIPLQSTEQIIATLNS